MALEVEEKKQRGEPLGPPPARTTVTKRRYDTTPSSATHRSLAPSVDGQMDIDNRSPNFQPTQTQNSPPSLPTAHPKLHPLALAQAGSNSTTTPTAASEEIRPKTQPRLMQGPRAEFFTDERKDAPTVSQLPPQKPQQPMQPPPGQNPQLVQRTKPVHTST